MAEETATRLRILGYPGSLGESSALDAALDAGARSVEFTGLCSWLVAQLKSVCPSIEESISPTQGPEEADSFQLEVSGVVSELHCPYTALTTGEVTTRLTSRDNCHNLLGFLISELQAARVLKAREPLPVETDGGKARGEIQLICQALEIEPKSLHNPALLTEVQNTVSLRLHSLPDSAVMNPLLKRQLDPELWFLSTGSAGCSEPGSPGGVRVPHAHADQTFPGHSAVLPLGRAGRGPQSLHVLSGLPSRSRSLVRLPGVSVPPASGSRGRVPHSEDKQRVVPAGDKLRRQQDSDGQCS
ncbi:protein FAM98A isoform X3 [Acipenser ruthenus]|uniref:protein FAM98A isoform X3 n=1 Tax=Acipenser ruthenus TaxID=7906 RepID=UPI0027414A33|nr:protein FAM98A isoform X3 [Acipenser ruthenus]